MHHIRPPFLEKPLKGTAKKRIGPISHAAVVSSIDAMNHRDAIATAGLFQALRLAWPDCGQMEDGDLIPSSHQTAAQLLAIHR